MAITSEILKLCSHLFPFALVDLVSSLKKEAKKRSKKGQSSASRLVHSIKGSDHTNFREANSRSSSQKKSDKSYYKNFKVLEEIASIRGKFLHLLKEAGKHWRDISCQYSLSCCGLPKIKKNRDYWYVTKSEYGRSYDVFKAGLKTSSKLKRDQHRWRGRIIAKDYFDREKAVRHGWIKTKSKNRYLLWKDPQGLGRFEWFETNYVKVFVWKPATLGRMKQLFSNAFFATNLITDINEFMQWIGTLRYKGHHETIDSGKRLPYTVTTFDDGFSRTTVKTGDRSHPHHIEYEHEVSELSFKIAERLQLVDKILKQNSEVLVKDAEAYEQLSKILKDRTQPRKETPDSSRMVV